MLISGPEWKEKLDRALVGLPGRHFWEDAGMESGAQTPGWRQQEWEMSICPWGWVAEGSSLGPTRRTSTFVEQVAASEGDRGKPSACDIAEGRRTVCRRVHGRRGQHAAVDTAAPLLWGQGSPLTWPEWSNSGGSGSHVPPRPKELWLREDGVPVSFPLKQIAVFVIPLKTSVIFMNKALWKQ